MCVESPRLRWSFCSGRALVVAIALLAVGCGSGGSSQSTGPSPPSPTISVSSLAFAPPSLVGGGTTQATVTLSSVAPSSGTSITLFSNNAAATVPQSVAVPAGATTASFTVSTVQVQTPVSVAISAAVGSSTTAATLSVAQIPICGPFLGVPVVMPLSVYTENSDPRNHFIPSGFFGDVADLSIEQGDGAAHSGANAVRIEYRPKGSQKFAGIFWQCGTFGDTSDTGFNLTNARTVEFWARAATNGAKAEFKVGGIVGAYSDSLPSTSTNPVIVDLGTDWRSFSIDVSNKDLRRIVGGFMFVTSTAQNPGGVTVYLDDIVWR